VHGLECSRPTRHCPTTGLVVPEHRDQRARLREIQPVLSSPRWESCVCDQAHERTGGAPGAGPGGGGLEIAPDRGGPHGFDITSILGRAACSTKIEMSGFSKVEMSAFSLDPRYPRRHGDSDDELRGAGSRERDRACDPKAADADRGVEDLDPHRERVAAGSLAAAQHWHPQALEARKGGMLRLRVPSVSPPGGSTRESQWIRK
jgi:hypothetical protein